MAIAYSYVFAFLLIIFRLTLLFRYDRTKALCWLAIADLHRVFLSVDRYMTFWSFSTYIPKARDPNIKTEFMKTTSDTARDFSLNRPHGRTERLLIRA